MHIASSLAFLIAVLCIDSALGIAPNYISDAKLAQSPVIVVAQWEKAPFRAHEKVREETGRGRILEEFEAYTKLRILRYICGVIRPWPYDPDP